MLAKINLFKHLYAFSLLLAIAGVNAQAQPTLINNAPAFSADELLALPRAGWLTNGGNITSVTHP